MNRSASVCLCSHVDRSGGVQYVHCVTNITATEGYRGDQRGVELKTMSRHWSRAILTETTSPEGCQWGNGG